MGLLLAHGVDVRARSSAGLSPLQIHLQRVREREGYPSAVIIRLSKKVAIYDDLTALQIGCIIKNWDMIENSLDAGVDVNARLASETLTWPGSTALHLLFQFDKYFWDERSLPLSIRNKLIERRQTNDLAFASILDDNCVVDLLTDVNVDEKKPMPPLIQSSDVAEVDRFKQLRAEKCKSSVQKIERVHYKGKVSL